MDYIVRNTELDTGFLKKIQKYYILKEAVNEIAFSELMKKTKEKRKIFLKK